MVGDRAAPLSVEPPARGEVEPPAHDEAERGERPVTIREARHELLRHVEALTEPVMVLLGLVFLGLVAVGYSGLALSAAERAGINRAQGIIYCLFVVDFGVRRLVAPAKLGFLKGNWLLLLSLVFPAVRPLHAARGLAGQPSFHLLRALTGVNRGLRALRQITRGRQFAFLLALSVLVVLVGAGGVLSFDRGAPGAEIRSFGGALWWAATLVTTINSAADPVSLEGRVVGLLLRVYAVTVFGYLTASIATYFIGGQGSSAAAAQPAPSDQIEALRREVAGLRRAVEGSGVGPGDAEQPGDARSAPSPDQ